MHADKRKELKKQKERIEEDLVGIIAAEEYAAQCRNVEEHKDEET
jgi:hypothetical protein